MPECREMCDSIALQASMKRSANVVRCRQSLLDNLCLQISNHAGMGSYEGLRTAARWIGGRFWSAAAWSMLDLLEITKTALLSYDCKYLYQTLSG